MLHGSSFNNDFLDMTQKKQKQTKVKIDKWDYIRKASAKQMK